VGLWCSAVACLRRSGPSAPKDARFGWLACLCRPLPRPPTCQPLEFPSCELPEVWPRCCLYPGRHFCADGLAVGRSRHSFIPSRSFASFLFPVRECRARACCNRCSNLDLVPGSHPPHKCVARPATASPLYLLAATTRIPSTSGLFCLGRLVTSSPCQMPYQRRPVPHFFASTSSSLQRHREAGPSHGILL